MGESFESLRLPDTRHDFLEQTRMARQKRNLEQRQVEAVRVIERWWRRVRGKKLLRDLAVIRFDQLFTPYNRKDHFRGLKCKQVFYASNIVVKYWSGKTPIEVLDKLCKYIEWTAIQENISYSYIVLGMYKDTATPWVQHLKDLTVRLIRTMTILEPEKVQDSKTITHFLNVVTLLTGGLCSFKIFENEKYKGLESGMANLEKDVVEYLRTNGNVFQDLHIILERGLVRPTEFAIQRQHMRSFATILQRVVSNGDGESPTPNPDGLKEYTFKIMTVPAYVYYAQLLCGNAFGSDWLPDILKVIVDNDVGILGLSEVLSLLANLIHMGHGYKDLGAIFYPDFATAISSLLVICAKHTECDKKSHWHPILGWVDGPVPSALLHAIICVKSQIEFLWGPQYLEAVFHPLLKYLKDNNLDELPTRPPSPKIGSPSKRGLFKDSWTRARKLIGWEQSSTGLNGVTIKFNSEVALKVSECCELFSKIISTLSIRRMDALTGLCFKQQSIFLVSLWKFMQVLGKDVKGWVEILLHAPRLVQESFILMFSEAMVHYITMLDDHEMYEEQKGLTLSELAKIGQFVNQICYRLITNPNNAHMRDTTWTSLKTLLLVLYRRDCRRKYCTDDHWLIESSKQQQLVSDIERGRKNAKRVLTEMPHVLREEARVILFRKWAASEKTLTGNSPGEHDLGPTSGASTLITIQRGRIVEDGYAQLANLSAKALKGTIRVRFQNELGLDEAGIDQDGVFKEFLEETIAQVFNPSLNLFTTTSENLLYPSPLSYMHDNHLQLFEFVGKMLAKAVYEGIVVDVHFASFFLNQILGYQQNALFSAIDELQSFDPILYQSLSNIKHNKGCVDDMELSFSLDKDVFGEIRNVELTPGGRLIKVTEQNKISYLYLMAHYHLYVQIKDQTNAFLRGFRSIIPNEWIRIFSPPELQRLISGEDTDIDLNDLRRNTQYYGGFHDNHRVIVWLWEILENDFIEKERRLFLKFVTSCSKPPLLGFANLEPPFSIRCVEVSDDEDTGDTLGSVIRGFLLIGKRSPAGRLPTSSTCFNLLKLPNYNKKATLRDKLRYAITSNVGFELS